MHVVHQRNEKTKKDISLMCATDVRDKKNCNKNKFEGLTILL